ncbi:hypothetical protein ACJMK2_014165, partial [Sinanodonta woodiana]
MRWDVRNFVILCAGIFFFCHTCDTAGTQAVCQGLLPVPCPYNSSDPASQLRCIHPSWLCDTESDCPDGSDEKNCGDCGKELFRCQEAPYTCIPSAWKCDGEVDCDDGSDESQCVHPENSFPCKPNEIRCAIGLQCIPLEHLCYTDKPECFLDDSFCLSFNCLKTDCGSDSWCAETPSGAKCYCESGKTFNESKCVDLDECQYDTYCDQPRLCKNTNPGFTCGCVDGYKLGDDNRSCLAINASREARLILLNDGKILQLYANGTSLPRYFYIEDQKATSLTFDYQGHKICWIGHQGGRGEASLTCMTVQDDLQAIPQISDLLLSSNTTTTLSTVHQVTLDWVTKNWYMTDPHFKRIVVCSRDGTKCKAVLNSTFVSGPKSLALDPTQGYIFFVDWDSPQSYIKRANLDGSDLRTIQGNSSTKSKLIKPLGLTLDYANQHVYWTDRDLNLVSRIDYDGTKKRVIYFGSLVKNVLAVSMLQNYLYLTDPFDKTISRVHRYDYNEAPKLLKDSNSLPVLTAPQHIEVFHQQRQPVPKWKNSCEDLNCEHLCLLTRSSQGQVSAKCDCSTGYKLSGTTNCTAKPECLSSNSDDYNEGCSLVRCQGDFSYCTLSDLCLPSEWWCDGKKDCPDGSDENEYCNYPACEITQFTCKNRRCIDQDFVCDSNDDCGDNSDEFYAGCGEKCAFDCKDNTTASSNSTCLKKSEVCDGKPDCVNKLDEKNCDVGKRPCESETMEFRCRNGDCIPVTYKCDGDRDCLDGSDEVNCTTNTSQCHNKEQFACSTTLCIPLSWQCDKERDCPNGEDETNCSTTKACKYGLKCKDGSKCLNFSDLCDGNKTCPDGSDEGGNCNKTECSVNNGSCSDLCTNTPSGHICHCPPGKKLDETNTSKCIAENPCEHWGICSQNCILDAKAVNGYRCHCNNGYLEPDNYTCKPLESDPVYVVFSNRHEIRRVDVMTNSYVSLIAGLRNTIALDFYYNESKVSLFWTDVMDDKIYRGTMMGNGITNIETVIDSGLATTEGLAVDWVGGNIYWVESNLDQIEVAKLDGSLRTTLVAGDMVSPRAIVVDPSHGALFWTDWDGLNPRIEGCSMSGEGRRDIYRIQPKEGGGWPNGLTLDYDFSRLYWIDARSESVHSIKYDGSDYRLILKDHKDMSHPFAISLFGIHFYWTDWSTNSVVRANKFTGGDIKTIQQTVTQPFDLQVVHPLRQPRSFNPCGKNNGNCSHLCLLSYNGTVGCHCPHQTKLDPKNNKTCIADNKFLLFVRTAEVRGVDLENAHYNVIPVITIPHVDNPSSIDFDQSDGLYWADTGLNVINRANVNGSDVETIIDSGLLHPEGLAIDWISGNIYFSSYDDKSASISVAKLNGAFRTELIKAETFSIAQPHSLAVHPTKGLLFWADKMNKTKLFKSFMDGSQPDVFVDGLMSPKSLAVDMKENLLIFIDENIIKKCSIDKQNCSQINTSITTFIPFALAVHEDYLYVSTSTEHSNIDSIIRFNRDGTGNKTLRSQTPVIKALRVYDKEWRRNVTHKNGCTGKNCSQLCLPVGNMVAVCRCTAGYSLSSNDTSCVGIKSFLLYAKESEIRGISFDKNDSVDALPPISKIQLASAVDFYAANDSIFWADTKVNSILRIKRDLSGRETILKAAISSVEGLAVDWIAGNVYWTDADHDTVEVSRLDGSNRYVLLSGGMEKPRSIAVHPTEGIFFWADWGSEPKIEKACLDGSNRTVFVSKINITTPYGLTIDYETNMLYWCDKSLDIIEKVDISTGDRSLIVHGNITDCMSMTVFKDYIYWIDTTDNKGAIKRANKIDGSSVEIVRQSLGTRLRDIKAFDAERQKGTNPCATNNGGCEQLCFYTGKGRDVSCRCSFGKLVNGTHCGEHNTFLLYSRVTAIESIDLDENNKNPPIKPIIHETRLRNVIGLAFDHATQTVFFSDIQRGEIQSIFFNGSGLTTVVEGIGSAEGLSFDSVNNDLYYTSYTNSCISRIHVRGNDRTSYTVMQMTPRDRLRAITVDSCGGMMYWTNWHDDKPGIHRATLNGLNHEQIISTEIRTPNGLSIDHPAQKLYWSDARLDKIERCNLDGTNRITLITSIPQHSFGLTVYQNYIYWTDWMLRGVLRANKYDGHGVVWLRKNLDRQPMAIIAVAGDSAD